MPTYVELVPDKRCALHIGLGQDGYSSVSYLEKPARAVAGKGALPTPDDAGFDYGGTWPHAPLDSAVPVAEAHQVAREFLTTGRRPTNLTWQDPRY
ncbi:Immunity protein Imm1 [Actinopolyspora alba]|uniref:Immunity protein Imm1 n=1 Tax=Actinopolyspora alba TaxID=673379 RepID=A0A1I2AUB3_9ACTN|nr:Imm1 family immunity protein [Actinopolyspora alba]SFE47502.1 Immunity protein Imm1 [Actinopolyspora alba]